MQKIEILIVGKHPEIMKTILRLINNKPGWNGTAAFTGNEAVEKGDSTLFDIVLLGAGLNEDEAEQIKTYYTLPVVQHYGGGSGLLYAEIYQGLNIKP
jgi:DNA-binding response OmpR family regulator